MTPVTVISTKKRAENCLLKKLQKPAWYN